jgi:hypothetical protein
MAAQRAAFWTSLSKAAVRLPGGDQLFIFQPEGF